MIRKVKATNKARRGEFDDRALPVFEGDFDEGDQRVELPDGSLAYAIDSVVQGVGLYRIALAIDAGENVHRTFSPAERGLGGITAPTGARGTGLAGSRGQLTCVGAEQVGWLDS